MVFFRQSVVKGVLITVAISLVIIFILVTLVLLPSILNGPDSVHYLTRTNCRVTEINYCDNLCLRDTSEYVNNLQYLSDWEECIVISLNSTTDNEISCKWYHPGFYKTQQEAFIATNHNYQIGTNYSCVLDIINNICYPDKNELIWFSSSVSSLFLLTIGIIGLIYYCHHTQWKKD